jgi:hypothetical protein
MDPAARREGFLLETHDEADDWQRARASLDEISGEHEMGRSARPLSRRIDEVSISQNLQQGIGVPVDIADSDYSRGLVKAPLFSVPGKDSERGRRKGPSAKDEKDEKQALSFH